jgi:glucose-6-phosphate isomerase
MSRLQTIESWQNLKNRYEETKNLHIKDLFSIDPNRFEKYSVEVGDILFDFSKNRIDDKTLSTFQELYAQLNFRKKLNAMFKGEKINNTERRSVLHTALRNFTGEPVYVDGVNVMNQISDVLHQMKKFVHSIHSGEKLGFSGKRFTDIVNIGIGGSDLGPAMACAALKPYAKYGIQAHFVSNVDSSDIAETLKIVDPETTLFIIASKTFTTQETNRNAVSARKWFLSKTGDNQEHIAKHFIALSTNELAVRDFGIDPENMFEFWNWVGGRYSIWSAIGISIALFVGWDNFEALLKGAQAMDEHFREADLTQNAPMMMATLSVWYSNFFNAHSQAIIPYNYYLNRFPAFLQQLEMESNGKSYSKTGTKLDYYTAPVIWGEAGTNAQHSFFQLLHQGSRFIPVDILAAVNNPNPIENHQAMLFSNVIAQSEALMNGKSLDDAKRELRINGLSDEDVNFLAPHKSFEGNKPTTTILFKSLTPEVLGSLIAAYEHKVFVQGIIWDINSFDQWGVELGKQLAGQILPKLNLLDVEPDRDASTNALIKYYNYHKK